MCCECKHKKKVNCGACPAGCDPCDTCSKKSKVKRACLAQCNDCDPCMPQKSMVKICTFVAPTLDEARYFHNSFVFNQQDDCVYYISDDGTPTRFGSTPMFIDNFMPDATPIPRQTVYDFAANKAYVFNQEGEYRTFQLDGGNQ